MSKLSSFSYKGSITNISAEFKTVWTEINDLNFELKDIILLTLLNNLSSEWNQYRTILNEKAGKDNAITFDDTVKGLINYEQGIENEVSAYGQGLYLSLIITTLAPAVDLRVTRNLLANTAIRTVVSLSQRDRRTWRQLM